MSDFVPKNDLRTKESKTRHIEKKNKMQAKEASPNVFGDALSRRGIPSVPDEPQKDSTN